MTKQKKITIPKNSTFVVASKVREAFKSADLRVSGEFFDDFNVFIGDQIQKVAARAQANGRVTIKGTDI